MNKSEQITEKINLMLSEDISISTTVDNHYHKYQVDFSGNGKTIATKSDINYENHTHIIINHDVQFVGSHNYKL